MRESLVVSARSKNPGTHDELHAREPGDPAVARGWLMMPRPGWFAGWQIDARRDARGTLGGNPSMNDRGKSDRSVLPTKSPNKPGEPGAEAVEGRGLPEGNTASETRAGRSAGLDVSSELDRVRQAARKDRDAKFTALLHHVTVDRLRVAYRAISPNAAAGVDGVTWRDYGQNLEANLRDLHARVQRGAYRASPSRRAYIPKPDGRLRPLGIAALEDKIVQRAVAEVLNAIYGKRRTTGMRTGMKGSYIEVLATHGGPGHALATREGAAKRWIRGARRPAIEPRNAFGRGADALVDDGRQYRRSRFSEWPTDPAGSENPLHACDLFMLRTGRSHDHPPVVMVGRVVRGRLRP
jgi:hypothetical protein